MIVDVAVGGNHVLVLLKGGELLAWGSNQYGQVGNGSRRDTKTPTLVLEHVRCIAAGEYHSMAADEDGDLYVWGCNSSGQLGDGGSDHCDTPKMVLEHIDIIAAGGCQSMALQKPPPKGLKRQRLMVWGMDVCDDGTARSAIANVAIVRKPENIWEDFNGGRAIVAMACGRNHSIIILENDECLTWGRNLHGQLGDGTTNGRLAPAKVADGIRAVSAGLDFTLAVTADGRCLAWGCNSSGRLGTGDLVDRLLPTEVLQGVAEVWAGVYHGSALLSNGDCVGWGCNLHECLADDLTLEVLRPERLLDGAKRLALGTHQSFAIMGSGDVIAWGLQAAEHTECLHHCRNFKPKPKLQTENAGEVSKALPADEPEHFHFSEERYDYPPLDSLPPPCVSMTYEGDKKPRKKSSPRIVEPTGPVFKPSTSIDWSDGGVPSVIDQFSGRKRQVRLMHQVHQRAKQKNRRYAVQWTAFRRELGPLDAEEEAEAIREFHGDVAAEVDRFKEDRKRFDDVAEGGWTTEDCHPTAGVLAMAATLEEVVKAVVKEALAAAAAAPKKLEAM